MKGFGRCRVLAISIACACGWSAVHAADQAITAQFLNQNRVPMYAADNDTFVTTDTIVDADGTQHTRMKRLYKGMDVIGGDVVIHSRQGVSVRDPSLTLRSTFRPQATPAISAQQATSTVKSDFLATTNFTARPGNVTALPSPHLVIYARGNQPVLAYESLVVGNSNTDGPAVMRYFTDANTGQVLAHWNLIENLAANGTGKSILFGDVPLTTTQIDAPNGTTFQLIDPTRGNGSVHNGTGLDAVGIVLLPNYLDGAPVFTSTNNLWGDSTIANPASAASDIAYGLSAAWDYYKTVHGRDGIFGNGTGVDSYAHFQFLGSSFNAGWLDTNGEDLPDGVQPVRVMLYGDGGENAGTDFLPFVALDVAGHEMSHGVTGATAKLVFANESGGLNESTSDIFGSMVEFHAKDPHEPGNYLIGEKLFASNPDGTLALRYMFLPSLDASVDPNTGQTVASADCWDATVTTLNPHFASGVGNHFFYLLAEGTKVPHGFGPGTTWNLTPANLVCGGSAHLLGVGRDAAQKIWYRALTVYMTANTDYADARTATLNAASDLYGSYSPQVRAVNAAWAAVNVH